MRLGEKDEALLWLERVYEDRDRAADKVFGGPVQSSCSVDLFSRSAALNLDRQRLLHSKPQSQKALQLGHGNSSLVTNHLSLQL